MSLIGNYSVVLKSPGRYMSGSSISDNRANNSGRPFHYQTCMAAGWDRLAGVPYGYRPTACWVLPRTVGGLSAGVAGSGDVTAASIAAGYNLAAAITGSGDITNALLGLIVSMQANLTGSGTVSTANCVGIGVMASALTGSGTITSATLAGPGNLAAALAGSGTITATIRAVGALSADIVSTGDLLTTSNVADAVLSGVIEAGYDLRDVLALLAARDLGASSGGPTTPAYKGLDGSTTRVTGTVDTNGNRSAITLTPG